MISAFAPSLLARLMLSRMKSSTAGLMLPSMEITSTWAGALPFWASAEKPAARNVKKRKTLSVFILQFFNDLLDVFPHEFFVCRIAQQISGMESRHQFNAVIGFP